jgi:hypothetical protein
MSESTSDALQREWQEELNEGIIVNRLLWVVESFYGPLQSVHELGMYYLVLLSDDSSYMDKHLEYVGDEEGSSFSLKWFPVSDLCDIVLLPAFLRTRLRALPVEIDHIIDRSNHM